MKSLVVAASLFFGGYSCDDTGGYVPACLQRLNSMPQGYTLPAKHYYSGGTWLLTRASCISRGAVFHFHGAHNLLTREIMSDGNDVQRSVFAVTPSLLHYLDSVGAFYRVKPHTVLTAVQIASMEPRVRLCGR